MSQLEQIWNKVQELLEEASVYLPHDAKKAELSESSNSMLTGNWQEYEEFVEHNEFELAWDALASLGKQYQTNETFWSIMGKAAVLMELEVKQKHAERMQKKKQLQIRQRPVLETTQE